MYFTLAFVILVILGAVGMIAGFAYDQKHNV